MNTQGIVSVSPMPRDNTGGGLKESLLKFRKHHSDVADALLNITGIGTPTGEPVEKDEDRIPYQHQEFPRMVYHVDGRELVVENDKELASAMKGGFRKEAYPKVRVVVADAATEKKAQQDTNLDMQARIRGLMDEIERLKTARP